MQHVSQSRPIPLPITGLLAALAALAALAVLAGCSSPVKINDNAGAPVESRSTAPGGAAGTSGAATQPAAQSQVTPVSDKRHAPLLARFEQKF